MVDATCAIIRDLRGKLMESLSSFTHFFNFDSIAGSCQECRAVSLGGAQEYERGGSNNNNIV